eukprot:TRINITY_DN68751_c0_g1_i1.p1 TRINITY_DN68751_c0_g1~~TRINITY_DN68751_c0_g1_i1.p1  ORF type:complete len:321 (+),score=59.01 TRINITY_DN68751_c0_g1_i1:191-1153(+)
MAAAGLPALLCSLYVAEGVIGTPLESYRIRTQLRAAGRRPQDHKLPPAIRGHALSYVRSLVSNVVTLAIEFQYYTGIFGVTLGAIVAHPFDTVRTRMALSRRPVEELVQDPFAGVVWTILRAAPHHYLQRIICIILAGLLGHENPPWYCRALALALASILTNPLDTLRHLDQAALVTEVPAAGSTAGSAVSTVGPSPSMIRPAPGAPTAAVAAEEATVKDAAADEAASTVAPRSVATTGSFASRYTAFAGALLRPPSSPVKAFRRGIRLLLRRPRTLFAGSLWSLLEAYNMVILRRWLVQLTFWPLVFFIYPRNLEPANA